MKKATICVLMGLMGLWGGVYFLKQRPYVSVTENRQQVVDMAGRSVSIPRAAARVYTATPTATEMVYTLCPDRLIGRTFEASAKARPFFEVAFLSKPVLGGWYGAGKEGNREAILLEKPDLIIFASYLEPDRSICDEADRMQAQLNCPVLVVDGRLLHLAETYRVLGRWLQSDARGEQLASYAETTLAEIHKKSPKIQRPVRVYYAEGPTGLQTDPSGSLHSLVLDLVGAENVAQLKIGGGIGRTVISPEQLIQWDPELVIVCPEHDRGDGASNYDKFRKSPILQSVTAIKTGAVYEIPSIPFNIIDRPPSIGRLLGLKWLGNLLYPDVYAYDVEQELQHFYQLFYRVTLTPAQVDQILDRATR